MTALAAAPAAPALAAAPAAPAPPLPPRPPPPAPPAPPELGSKLVTSEQANKLKLKPTSQRIVTSLAHAPHGQAHAVGTSRAEIGLVTAMIGATERELAAVGRGWTIRVAHALAKHAADDGVAHLALTAHDRRVHAAVRARVGIGGIAE